MTINVNQRFLFNYFIITEIKNVKSLKQEGGKGHTKLNLSII